MSAPVGVDSRTEPTQQESASRASHTSPTHEAVMAQAPRENFPVASVILPSRQRRQLMAIYGVARLIDDVGDESAGDRNANLDWLDAELDQVFSGSAPEHPTMRALATAKLLSPLPEAPFRALVQANRQDQVVTRYETFDQLLGYCRLSAAPVGELVLHVFDAATPDRIALSERICAGLQVIEHIQDVAEDYARGRVYMPREDMKRFGCSEADLSAPRRSDSMRAMLAFESSRAARLLDGGAPLAPTLPMRPRIAVAGFVAGGRAALDSLARASYDVALGAPSVRRGGAFAKAFARAVTGR
jgi:squalene synthase HpnC